MPFEIAQCGPEDMERAFTIVSEAFKHDHPYIDYMFPRHDTTAGRRIGGERFVDVMNGDPNTTYVKAIDTDTKIMVGLAKWNIYDGVIPDEVELGGDYWDSEEDKDLAKETFTSFLQPRRQAIRDSGGHLVSLDIMVVHPDYQRRGAGQKLQQWGIERADRMGVKTVVEASQEGRGLYEKGGFEVEIEWYTTSLSDRFADRPKQGFIWMVRPAKR